METSLKNVKPMVYQSKINVPYHWWAGATASRFFVALRDERKIIAPKCERCDKVYIPPRKICPVCFTENMTWTEVAPEGTVETFTIARRQLAAIPRKVPVIYALIQLDGADTAMLHILEKVAPEAVKIGMRVKACFAAERTGHMDDIMCFEPA